MNLSQDLFLKNRLVIMKLARDFLIMELGQKIPTISEYEEKFGMSRGTVQSAMLFLNENGCIHTNFRGHLGTYLVQKDFEKLWEFSGYGSLTGAMVLPLNTLVSGLATGICDCMKQAQIPFNLTFLQGSRVCVNAMLKNRCDFVVFTTLAWDQLREENLPLEFVQRLPDCYYSGEYKMMFADPSHTEVKDGMRVTFDPSSIDQMFFTKKICEGKKNIHFIERTYLNTIEGVADGTADVVACRSDAARRLYPDRRFVDIKLPDYTPEQISVFPIAVLLTSENNYGLKELLNMVIDPVYIAQQQRGVMSGARMPSYY